MILNPWFWLGCLLALALSGFTGYRHGAKVERANWQGKENARLVETNKRIREGQEEAAREHRQHELSLAAIGSKLATERTAHEALRRADRERALAGDLRLRDPGARVCPTSAEGPPAAAGRSDGPAPGELSRPASAFLFELADDADEVAKQLASCQEVVEADRK